MSDLPIDDSSKQSAVTPGLGWPSRRLSRMLLSRVNIGRLTIITPSGLRLHNADGHGPEGVLILRRWQTLMRLLFQGDIGMAEAYIYGEWDSPDLPALIELAGLNISTLSETFAANGLLRLRNRFVHRLNANTRRGSRRNIRHHYDLGNMFYRAWLDRGMSYSSALFSRPDETLEQAQAAKERRILALMDTSPGQHVLEIGCGWGSLAERLVRDVACRVTGVTLSPAQLEYASNRLSEAGLNGAAELRLQDYRDVEGSFDRIVSVEMLEAVGEAYWPSYFSTLADRLKPGGQAVLQAISISEETFDGYRRCTDFIQHYIFPGGMLPTIAEIRRQTERAGMVLQSMETFGASYAQTLAEWRKRFHAAWPELETQGFDSRFRRTWDYYLAYCEGGFRAGTIDVGLYVLAKPA
jgi:cyclopropane-fatty-acyl-phospholipid synthase